jgi:hypothetical protein
MLSCHVSIVPAGTPRGGRAQYAGSLLKVEASPDRGCLPFSAQKGERPGRDGALSC